MSVNASNRLAKSLLSKTLPRSSSLSLSLSLSLSTKTFPPAIASSFALESSTRGSGDSCRYRYYSTTPNRLAAKKKTRVEKEFEYEPLFQSNVHDTSREANHETEFVRILPPEGHVESVVVDGIEYLRLVDPKKTLAELSEKAFGDIAHLLRPKHLGQLRSILDDPEASKNDKFVALELLRNADIASGRVLPGCQDTGTAIVSAKRGHRVLTDGNDDEYLSLGAYEAYKNLNLRYSQVAPLDMFEEKNTGTNLPAQIDVAATKGDEYKFLFMAKGGGSANKTFLYQQTKALLNPGSLEEFLGNTIKTIGTSACPPYHLAIVVGGLSAELNLKTVKMASTKFYDDLPTTGSEGGRAFRDVEWEKHILEMTRNMGIGAQFGGKYFCHDVRVVRLPRHGASCPVGIGVSCSADRQVLAKINKDGVFIERLETDVSKYIPDVTESDLANDDDGQEAVSIDLDSMSMTELREALSKYPTKTRLSLTGTIVVARDIAHAKMLAKIESGEGLPDYAKNNIIYYAGPAKTPEGYASGSFGPTTAGRMDAYVSKFMENGGSFVTLAKGNRSKAVTNACKKYGGFYLGSIGGPAAILAKNCIKNVEVLDNEEDGMEAVWKIDVVDFPAFIVVDDKGDDFFKEWLG
eukprot:jgi/Psemu1/300333/fgenesh1_kg.10_\